MNVRNSSLALASCAAFLVAIGATTASGDPLERITTLADQRRVDLTIYNAQIALVHDRRRVDLAAGSGSVAWRDVSGQLDATSAILTDVGNPGAVRVDEQNFDYDLLRPQTLLEKYVGRDVTVVHERPGPGEPRRETARVLATNDGIVLKYRDRIETGLYDSHIVYATIPDDLRDRPTLTLDLATQRAGAHDLDLAYLTGGLGWHAEYVGSVSPDERRLALRGLVTLSNTTGTTFANAHLQLVAGNVNVPAPTMNAMQTIGRVAAAPTMTQQNFFEYHLYSLATPTTIANAQTKQVALLAARDVPLRKTLELRGSQSYYFNADADLGAKLPVGAYLTFTNKGGDLGVPLPGGLVRLYKNDPSGASLFLGADRIDHTPRNQDVRLHVGDSFDVTANKKQLAFHALGDCTFRSDYRIVVSNAKTEAADVLVVEPIPGDWTIEAESSRHVKTSSATATWTLRVPPDASTTLDYTARVRLCF